MVDVGWMPGMATPCRSMKWLGYSHRRTSMLAPYRGNLYGRLMDVTHLPYSLDLPGGS